MFIEFLDKTTATSLSGTGANGRFDTDADTNAIRDWVKKGQGPQYLNYAAQDESLLLVWDDSKNTDLPPEITVVADFIDPDIVHVFMNGIPMAEVNGDPNLTIDDIALIPLSAAQVVGLTPC